jgi:hypothetical protein
VTDSGGPHWLLIRRSITGGDYASYRAHAPGPVPLGWLVKVAGSRWKIEDGSAAGKELAALDEHQVPRRHQYSARECHYRRRALKLP